MTADVLDLNQAISRRNAKIDGLQRFLTPLLGEPFQFARVSYGEELTLHLGQLRAANSSRLKLKYGSYVIGMRASSWMIKAGKGRIVTSSLVLSGKTTKGLGKQLTSRELEQSNFIDPNSRVVHILPFTVKPTKSIGLQLQFSDDSVILILPFHSDDPPIGKNDEGISISDWEISMPHGHLSIGPGLLWSYRPRQIVVPQMRKKKQSKKEAKLASPSKSMSR